MFIINVFIINNISIYSQFSKKQTHFWNIVSEIKKFGMLLVFWIDD